MKHIWENEWCFVPIAMFCGFSGMLALLVPYSDEILFFNDLRIEPFNALFRFFTHCGEIWAFLVFGIAALFWKPRYGLMIALLGLLCLPVGYVLKDFIAVDRPLTFFEKKEAVGQVVLVPDIQLNRGQTSFPSGHTMAGFALYSLLTLMAGRKHQRWGIFFAFMAIFVGISRIFLVQHFLADVLGGALIGLTLTGLLWQAASRYFPKL